ncbi:hypothetical protein HanIR_Chr03g0108831 [Helianthus annuus]|nr:hypothetical protein HanIR_Chr03g0108831 [Helianthus annuus]
MHQTQTIHSNEIKTCLSPPFPPLDFSVNTDRVHPLSTSPSLPHSSLKLRTQTPASLVSSLSLRRRHTTGCRSYYRRRLFQPTTANPHPSCSDRRPTQGAGKPAFHSGQASPPPPPPPSMDKTNHHHHHRVVVSDG